MVVLVLEFEVGMQLCDGIHLVCPDDAMSTGRDDGVQHTVGRNLIFHRVVLIIADIEACHVEVCVGGVIEFKPVVVLEPVVDIDGIACTHLIDAQRGDELRCKFFVGEFRETGGE